MPEHPSHQLCSTSGCSSRRTAGLSVCSRCHHDIIYVVIPSLLLLMFLQKIPEEEHKALQIISYIGCGISSVCLIISIVFFLLQGWDIGTRHGVYTQFGDKMSSPCIDRIFLSSQFPDPTIKIPWKYSSSGGSYSVLSTCLFTWIYPSLYYWAISHSFPALRLLLAAL